MVTVSTVCDLDASPTGVLYRKLGYCMVRLAVVAFIISHLRCVTQMLPGIRPKKTSKQVHFQGLFHKGTFSIPIALIKRVGRESRDPKSSLELEKSRGTSRHKIIINIKQPARPLHAHSPTPSSLLVENFWSCAFIIISQELSVRNALQKKP